MEAQSRSRTRAGAAIRVQDDEYGEAIIRASGCRSVPQVSLVTRHPHALGRADAYDAALLDVAEDHLLYLLAEAGMFTDGQLVF